MNRRLLWYGLAFVVGIAVSLGFLFKTPLTGSEEMGVVENGHINIDKEVELLISTFISQLVNGNVLEASRYTTGDLQSLLESNKNQNVSGVLLDHQIDPTFSNDRLVQAKVSATVKTQIGIDRQHYLYELVKRDDQWRIYRIDEMPFIKIQQEEISQVKAPAVIESYLNEVAKGNWTKSMDYLAGEALLEVQKTFTFLPKNYSTKLDLKDQEIIAENNNGLWVLSTYTLTSPDQKIVTRETVFQLEKADREWKITQISNVTGGDDDNH